MKIIKYENRYKDDMIFMVLEAKNALGRVPHLNDDLLNIDRYYFQNGDMFFLAIDENDRVIGCVGYNRYNQDSAKLHRFYVKHDLKRQGIGTALLKTVEYHIKEQGYKYSIIHLGGKEYFESRQFYPKHGYIEYEVGYMRKEL